MKYYQIIYIQNFTQNPQVLILLMILDVISSSTVSQRAWFWAYYGWGLFWEYGGRSILSDSLKWHCFTTDCKAGRESLLIHYHFSLDQEGPFEANLSIVCIYTVYVDIAEFLWSTQAGFLLDGTEVEDVPQKCTQHPSTLMEPDCS